MKKTRFIALSVIVLYVLNLFCFVSYAAPDDEHKKYTKLLYENDFDSAESFAAWTLGVAAENKPNMHHQVSGTNYDKVKTFIKHFVNKILKSEKIYGIITDDESQPFAIILFRNH